MDCVHFDSYPWVYRVKKNEDLMLDNAYTVKL